MVLTAMSLVISVVSLVLAMLALATVHHLGDQLKETTRLLEKLDKDLRG